MLNWPSETVAVAAAEEPGSGQVVAAVSGSSAPSLTAGTLGAGSPGKPALQGRSGLEASGC